METETRRELRKVARQMAKSRAKYKTEWAETKRLMKQASEESMTFTEIGEIVGVTKGRVYQIVTGNRGGKKKAEAAAKAEANGS